MWTRLRDSVVVSQSEIIFKQKLMITGCDRNEIIMDLQTIEQFYCATLRH